MFLDLQHTYHLTMYADCGSLDNDLIVPFPLNLETVSMNPQRLLYPRSEIDNNENVPTPLPSLFEPTPVNQ